MGVYGIRSRGVENFQFLNSLFGDGKAPPALELSRKDDAASSFLTRNRNNFSKYFVDTIEKLNSLVQKGRKIITRSLIRKTAPDSNF